MDDPFFPVVFFLTIFILAIFGAFFIFTDVIHPQKIIDLCKKNGYYQYQQTRLTCSVEKE